jgi:oxaloacetate decarboxylase (Na+ extruding) subunit alpha
VIELVDQTFRDGQQSLWGMRLRGGMLRKVAAELDRSGFRAVEVTGSSLMECSVRYSREDPWESLDLWRTWLPSSELRSPVCQNRIGTFGMTPDALMDLWVRTLVRHGIDALWVYDCLYNMAQMKRLCDVIAETGAKALGAIMYGISPVHTDEWFAQRVRQMASWPSVSAIYVEDAPGILTPERARTLIPAVLAAAGDKPVEWHFHNNTAMGALNYMIAVELGGTILHTCSRPLANGPSLPSTEQTVANLDRLGFEHGIDEAALPPVADHCARIARQEGWLVGEPVEFDTFAYKHHLPGGMTGTLKAQLRQYDMEDRLVEVLEECVKVREELGHPISATPFSQLIGIQSVLNIVTGDRWSVVPDEVIIYLMGKFGTPPAPVDENVRDKVLTSSHGRRFAGWERPQPSLKEIREQYGGAGISDEELLLRYMVPLDDLQAAYDAGPVKPTYDFRDDGSFKTLVDHALTLKRARHVRIRTPQGSLSIGS